MKEYIKKIVRFISVKPIIGPPVRVLAAMVRLPQMRDMIFENNHQINEIKQQISENNLQINEIKQQINEIKQQISEIKQQISEIKEQVNEVKQYQHVFDTECLPGLLESLDYQENLKKSLPVVLRQYRRSILKHEKITLL